MKFKKFTVSALLLSALLLLSSCGHTHSFGKWNDYGSYQARVCDDCGYIEREYYDGRKSNPDTQKDTETGGEVPGGDVTDDTGIGEKVFGSDVIVCIREITTYSNSSWKPYQNNYIYDENGVLIRKEGHNLDTPNGIYSNNETTCTFTYNDDGTLHEEIIGTATITYYYDSEGRVSEIKKSSNKTQYKSTYRKENGRLIETYTETDEKGITLEYEITYNADGNKEHMVFKKQTCTGTWSTFSCVGEQQYIYDSNGLLSRVNEYNYSLDGDDNSHVRSKVMTSYTTYEYTTLSDYLDNKSNYDFSFSSGNTYSGNNSGSGVTPKTCPACLGKKSKECNGCDGKGKVLSYYDINHNPVYSTCPICHGIGSISCKVCGGDGTIYD